MISKIYKQLKTAKTLDEVHSRFNEVGIDWNKSQIRLFLEMDKNITGREGLFSVGNSDLEHKVIKALDELFIQKPKIPISKIMEEIPFTIGKSELLSIVEKSESYYTPNGVIISKK